MSLINLAAFSLRRMSGLPGTRAGWCPQIHRHLVQDSEGRRTRLAHEEETMARVMTRVMLQEDLLRQEHRRGRGVVVSVVSLGIG